MKKTLKVVLDTSIFVNPDSRHLFGETPQEALLNFLDKMKDKKEISCHIPPSVYEELMQFMEGPLPIKRTILIDKKPPSSYETPVPALLVYEFIEEIRSRINKGLRVAEKYARKGLKSCLSDSQLLGKEGKEEEIIKNLREEYRTALREGIIDSKEDFDLILLAKEINAVLVTSDNGLIQWAQKLGITCMGTQELKELLK
jgi:RNA ligase partner protein